MLGVLVLAVPLPEKLLERLRRIVEAEGKTVEEVFGEAVLKYLDIGDPDAKVELHLKLCEKYLSEAWELLGQKRLNISDCMVLYQRVSISRVVGI